MNSERLKMIDLFSGAGGLSEGLSEAGFHSLFASEIVPVYAQTYKKNHPDTNVFTADIRTLDANEVRTTLGIERGELDLIAGGPPCQGFSINAPVRTTLDERNHLFKEYLRFVDAFAPRAVLIENVPGLVSFEHGATLHAILNALAELGYGADVRILGAPYYGVPQMRWRTIILGVRGRTLPAEAYPEPIYHAPIRANFTSTFDGQSIIKEPSPEANANFVTVYEAIGDLPPLVSGEQGEVIKEYRCDAFCAYQRRSRLGSVGVMNHEAKCDPHWGAFFHYEQNRSFTVREAARLQSFPDHFVFTGNLAEQFAQVGNAVPPLLAQAVGLSLRSILEMED